jgi:hypothetical protein
MRQGTGGHPLAKPPKAPAKKIRDALDGDVPDDVPHWIVEFQIEFDDRDLTPLLAAKRAYDAILRSGHCCVVTHVRSGLMWSIALSRQEVVEIDVAAMKSPASRK